MSSHHGPPLPLRTCFPSRLGARLPLTRFSPKTVPAARGRTTAEAQPDPHAVAAEPRSSPGALSAVGREATGAGTGGGRSGAPCGSCSLYHLSLTLQGGNVPVLPVPQPGCSRNPPSPAQLGGGQPPPLSAALTVLGRRADFINQTAEQPSPALTAPQPCSRVPLQFSERNSVEERLYTVSTKLFIRYIHI